MNIARSSTRALALLLALASCSPAAAQRGLDLLDEERRAVHLLNRATFGVRAQDVDHVLDVGVSAWLDQQLHPERIDDPVLATVQERFPAAHLAPDALLAAYPRPQDLAGLREQLQDSAGQSPAQRQAIRKELGEKSPARILGELTAAKLNRAAHSERQVEEMMTDFWFDHFNVFWGKAADRWLVGDYEHTAIRPHVFGSFEDMLVATASHPAMLFYLDNWRSMAPDTAALRRAAARRRGADRTRLDERLARLPGLNENYARELLELHTLGVDGGYTQADVVDVARAFTGWTIQMPGRRDAGGPGDRPMGVPYTFSYRDPLHDQGDKTVLGHRLPSGRGVQDGHDVLRLLATHPSTARHIATQLATRFVSDEPPPALVDELARVFLDTGGDLREVTRALFTAEAFYAPEHAGARIKSPVLLVASALRVTGAHVVNPRDLIETMRALGQAPYLAEAPTGYDESSLGWASSGAMVNRMSFGVTLATGQVSGVRLDLGALGAMANEAGPTPLDGLGATVLPGADVHELVVAVREDLASMPAASEREAGARALGIMLGSPEFQRH